SPLVVDDVLPVLGANDSVGPAVAVVDDDGPAPSLSGADPAQPETTSNATATRASGPLWRRW
ncbi:MAG: hypothetical protein M3N15_07405, partial [Actinomycetota bacterium]|nr:hypothetical protein [Actinomycetota bacterium]